MARKGLQKRQAEFVEMLHRCEGALYKVCFLYTDSSYDEVQDLYQEMALNLWKNYGSFRGKSKELTWVYRIALRTARRQRREHLARQACFVRFDPVLHDTLTVEMVNERMRLLHELVDLLDDDERGLAALFLEDRSVKEMAEVLGCTERTVERHLAKLKHHLNELNEKEWG